MIERYTIKFGPAVSQKELEKALHEPVFSADEETLEPGEQLVRTGVTARLHKMKARIEVIADFADLQKVAAMLKEMSSHQET